MCIPGSTLEPLGLSCLSITWRGDSSWHSKCDNNSQFNGTRLEVPCMETYFHTWPFEVPTHGPQRSPRMAPSRGGATRSRRQTPHASAASQQLTDYSSPWYESFLVSPWSRYKLCPGWSTETAQVHCPLPGEYGTCKAVKAGFWPWLPVQSA